MKRLLCLLATLSLGACADHETAPASLMLGVPYPDSIDAEGRVLRASLIARGDAIFHGVRPGGTCFSCHGNNLRGGPITSDLTDGSWVRVDGSWSGIRRIIGTGVPDNEPPMPPAGGMALTTADLDALAAYVYWRAYRHPAPSAAAPPPPAAGQQVPQDGQPATLDAQPEVEPARRPEAQPSPAPP
jgi:mono/diheme cytochrome c family protein